MLQERDLKNFQRLTEALTVVGFTEEDMDSIFQVSGSCCCPTACKVVLDAKCNLNLQIYKDDAVLDS